MQTIISSFVNFIDRSESWNYGQANFTKGVNNRFAVLTAYARTNLCLVAYKFSNDKA